MRIIFALGHYNTTKLHNVAQMVMEYLKANKLSDLSGSAGYAVRRHAEGVGYKLEFWGTKRVAKLVKYEVLQMACAVVKG